MNEIQTAAASLEQTPRSKAAKTAAGALLAPEPMAWIFAALLLGRIVIGPGFDVVFAGAGVGAFFSAAKGPGRVAWFFAGLALLALGQILLPRWSEIAPLAAPAWSAAWLEAPSGRWSQAPWEGGRWAMIFAGAALWAPVFRGGRRFRRSLGLMLRTLGVVLAAWLVWCKLTGATLGMGENHFGILLAMLLCEPAGRLRDGDVFVWLSVAMIAAGIVIAGAWAPLALGVLVVVAGASDFSRQSARRQRLLGLAWLAPVLLAVALAGFWGGVGVSGRLAIWQDSLSLLHQSWPWGTGFGSFRWVFPAFAEALPKPGVRALHPENAYLWFAIEGGAFAMLCLAALWGGCRRSGQAAKNARLALLVLGLECLIETPVLWSPIVWLLPLLLNQGFVWRGNEAVVDQKVES